MYTVTFTYLKFVQYKKFEIESFFWFFSWKFLYKVTIYSRLYRYFYIDFELF